jgi:hypothetical protein
LHGEHGVGTDFSQYSSVILFRVIRGTRGESRKYFFYHTFNGDHKLGTE